MAVLKARTLKHQQAFIDTTAKYTALVCGLGAGKTEALLYSVLRDISVIPKAQIMIAEPTVDLLKRIIYPRLEDILAGSGIMYKLNRSESIMDIWMPMGKCTIVFRSMEVPSRLIGLQVHKSYIDELDVLPKDKAFDVWIRILARTRLKYKNPDGTPGMNSVHVTTTPEGFRMTYELWVKEHKDNPDYKLLRGKTMDNHHLPADYVSSLEKTFTGPQGKAYLLGEFVNLKGLTVYSSFDRFKNNTDLTISDFPTSQMINIGWDFNVGRSAAAVLMRGDGDMVYQVNEFHHVADTPAMIDIIKATYPNRIITVFPDASGRSRKSVDASKSDIRLIRDAGFRVNAPKKNPPIRQRVVSTNVMFMDGHGERRLMINGTTCPYTVECLEKQVYTENGDPEKDNTGTDDMLDALTYCIDRIHGLAKPTASVGRMRFGI